jgi:hypothetical protein
MITQYEIKSVLNYNPDTGDLVWTDCLYNRIRKGKVAGNPTKLGYQDVMYKGKTYKAHRLIWLHVYGELPDLQIDHIDGNGLNNRISNLRLCTQFQNKLNSGKPKTNTSGHKGVSWHKRLQKWQTRCVVDGERTHLGYFTDKEEANKVYQTFAKSNHGEFYKDTTKKETNDAI